MLGGGATRTPRCPVHAYFTRDLRKGIHFKSELSFIVKVRVSLLRAHGANRHGCRLLLGVIFIEDAESSWGLM